MNSADTMVLTLGLEAGAQLFFERMRQAHFPAERNQIPAHLTLFHTLPHQAEVSDVLRQTAAHTPPFSMAVTGLRSLGRGVAYTLESSTLLRLHAGLAAAFAPHLSAQDRQRFRPHVVVQNKVSAEQARTLLVQLERDFHSFEVQAVGLALWHYLGGPWKLAEHFPFAAEGVSR